MLNTTGRCECWLIPLMLFKLHSLDRRISLRWFNQATCAISPIEKILWKLTSPPQRSRILTPNVSNWSPSPFNDKSSLFLAVEQGESCHWVLRAIHYFLPHFFFLMQKTRAKPAWVSASGSSGRCFSPHCSACASVGFGFQVLQLRKHLCTSLIVSGGKELLLLYPVLIHKSPKLWCLQGRLTLLTTITSFNNPWTVN